MTTNMTLIDTLKAASSAVFPKSHISKIVTAMTCERAVEQKGDREFPDTE